MQMSGVLKDSLIVGESDNQVVMGFIKVKEPKFKASSRRKKGFATLQISGASDLDTTDNVVIQEQHFGKSIFAPTDAETEKSLKIFEREMQKTITKALGNKTIKVI